MALLDIVDNAALTRLQRFVQATTLVPGDASVSAKQVNDLARAVKAFAEASAHRHSSDAMDQLIKAYAGTGYEEDLQKRVDSIRGRWRLSGYLPKEA